MALLLPLRESSRFDWRKRAIGMERSVTGAFASSLHVEDATDGLIERSFASELGLLVPGEAGEMVAPVASAEPVETAKTVDESQYTSGATEPTVVRPIRGAYERAVPLTRTPLRHMACAITWPNLIELSAGSASRSERHALLKRLDHESCPLLEAVLLTAYAEEDADGRVLALRSLLRHRCAGAREVFVDALCVGSDDERSFAVDALVAIGDRDALPPALSDRVEAIAARAAFAYVGSYSRADYAAALEPFIDRARIEAIMALLAGVVQ